MRNGRGEADLRAQRRDHEGQGVEHGAGAKRAPLTRWADDDAPPRKRRGRLGTLATVGQK